MVDSIEYHVEQSRGTVAQGHQELVKAKEYQSKARKVHHRNTKTILILIWPRRNKRKGSNSNNRPQSIIKWAVADYISLYTPSEGLHCL